MSRRFFDPDYVGHPDDEHDVALASEVRVTKLGRNTGSILFFNAESESTTTVTGRLES